MTASGLTTSGRTGAPGWTRGPRVALALLALPSLLLAIDISVLNVALPRMAADLHPSPTELLWMNDIYGFMVGGTMITMGTVGDRIGRRKLIILCAMVFAVASAFAAFATEPWMIIATRAVMGVAGAAIMPASMALIGRIYPDPKASVAAMGAYMTCFLTGMAVGPLVGGVLVEHWGWGSVFLMGVPVMLLTVVAAPRVLPEFRASDPGRLDVRSAVLCLASILLVVYALKSSVNSGFSWLVVAAACVGVVLGVVFVRRQKRLAHPLVDLGLLARPGVARTMWVLLLTAVVMGGTSLFVTFYLQSVQGLTPLVSAMWLLPQMAAMIVASNLGPWLGRRVAQSRLVAVCMGMMTVGFALFALVPDGPAGLAVLTCATVLTTGGIGAALPFLMNDVIAHAPPDRAGSAASFTQTANEIGIAMGLVVLGSVGTVTYRDRLGQAGGSWVDGFAKATGDPTLLDHVRHAFTSGFHAAGATCVGIMLVVLVLTVRLRRRSPAE
ncbi:MFS transporter [Actinophytocola oryzae]|uniref:DHA2 family multidrug resistance protein-like MFS transporter n=1 Tax=Actinophytocola oryzae TaxID=502181 RepID=A0A4R7VFC5_9PSEU|nr:MFS transporter [Actinophytocola oryzae]TDV47943.1 DHA2 family multidrug resistance protein-like MFS transporter [Actinophytocola oryzae]